MPRGERGTEFYVGGSVSDIQVGVTLQQFNADLSRIFEDDQDSQATSGCRARDPHPKIRPGHIYSWRLRCPRRSSSPYGTPSGCPRSSPSLLGQPKCPSPRSPHWSSDSPRTCPHPSPSGVLAVWAPSAFRAGSALNIPGTPAWRGLAAALSPPVAAAGLAVAVLGTPSRTVAVATPDGPRGDHVRPHPSLVASGASHPGRRTR